MIHLPESIEENEDSYAYLSENWNKINLPEFCTLFNELILILEKLG